MSTALHNMGAHPEISKIRRRDPRQDIINKDGISKLKQEGDL